MAIAHYAFLRLFYQRIGISKMSIIIWLSAD